METKKIETTEGITTYTLNADGQPISAVHQPKLSQWALPSDTVEEIVATDADEALDWWLTDEQPVKDSWFSSDED